MIAANVFKAIVFMSVAGLILRDRSRNKTRRSW
jgi:hypothetical protein